jgi:sortase A
MITGRRALSVAAALLLMASVCLLAYVAHATLETRSYQREAYARLEIAVTAPGAAGEVPHEGDLLGEMSIDRLGLHAVITEGESDGVLRRAVGHVPGTAPPGEYGNVALAGHRDGFFRPLRDIRLGDVITVTTGGHPIDYAVEWTKVVAPEDVWVIGPVSGHTLTLITCYPFTFVGSAPNRFIVRARELEMASE